MAHQHEAMKRLDGCGLARDIYGGEEGTSFLWSKVSLTPPIRETLLSSECFDVNQDMNTSSPRFMASSFQPSCSASIVNKWMWPAYGNLVQNLLSPSKEHFLQQTDGGSLVLDATRAELMNAPKITSKDDAKALAASRSHSQAERRRRERINSHLSMLRTLLPSTIKIDKASLLAEVIQQLKTLKHQVTEICDRESIPTDHDRLYVEMHDASTDKMVLIRATICCNDCPDLLMDLKDAINKLKLKLVKAEIATLGDRIKIVFVMTLTDGTEGQDISIEHVQEGLQAAMDRPRGGELSPSNSNKRQRIMAP